MLHFSITHLWINHDESRCGCRWKNISEYIYSIGWYIIDTAMWPNNCSISIIEQSSTSFCTAQRKVLVNKLATVAIFVTFSPKKCKQGTCTVQNYLWAKMLHFLVIWCLAKRFFTITWGTVHYFTFVNSKSTWGKSLQQQGM